VDTQKTENRVDIDKQYDTTLYAERRTWFHCKNKEAVQVIIGFDMERAAHSTRPEDIFVDLFREVFGLAKAQMLAHEFPYRDFLGNTRFIDYALKTTDNQIAFEIDGPDHYNPQLH
jgi:hypothetical protein